MISINGDELQKISGTTFIDKVVQLFIQQGGVAKSPFGDVVLDRKGAKNSKSHGIGSSKAQAYAAIKDVLEQGAIQLPMAQYNTNPNKKLLTGMIAANIQIGSVPYTCVVEVCKNADGLIRLYNHEVTPIQTQKPQDVVATSRVSDGEITTRQHQGAMAKIAKDFQNTNTQIKNQQDTNMKTENRKRNVVRLTESQLKQMITESVRWTLNEWQYGPYGEPSYDDVDLDRSAFHNVGARPSNEPIRKKELSAIEQFNEKIGSSNGILQQLHMFLYDNENIDQKLKQHICARIRSAMQTNTEAQNIITDYCRENNIKNSMESPWEL